MKLIIHIGTEKTGSSSVQQWGAKNRDLLKENGVFYSESLGVLDHRKASVYARLPHLADDGFSRYGITDAEQHVKFKQQVEQALAEEVELAKQLNCRYFVVSSEHFHSRIDSVAMVEEASKLFTPHFDDIEILAYIRPQAELFQSRISVNIRNLDIRKTELIDKWQKDITYFDNFAMWQRWSSVFKKVTFKPFNKYKNVVADIAKMVGVSLEDFAKPARVNEKLDYRMGIVAHQLNEVIESISMKKELLNLYFEQIECKEPITISRALASKINAFYRESNLAFCKANSDFSLTDIETDFKKFPVEGTADKMFENSETIAFLVQILIRNYCDINLLHCENEFVKIERALARGNVKNAAGFKLKLTNLLAKFDGMNFDSQYNLVQVSAKINALKNKLQSIKV